MAFDSSGYRSNWVLKWGAEAGSDASKSWDLPSRQKILSACAGVVVVEVGRSL